MDGLLDVDQFGTKNLGERLITFPKTKKENNPSNVSYCYRQRVKNWKPCDLGHFAVATSKLPTNPRRAPPFWSRPRHFGPSRVAGVHRSLRAMPRSPSNSAMVDPSSPRLRVMAASRGREATALKI